MARDFSNPLQVARFALMSDKAWLLYVLIPRRSGGEYRLVRSMRHQRASNKLWLASSIEIQVPDEDSEGTLGQLTLAVPNVSRIPMQLLEEKEILGQTITCWLCIEGQDLSAILSWQHTALKALAREPAVQVTCGHAAENQQVPSLRYNRVNFPQLLPQGGINS